MDTVRCAWANRSIEEQHYHDTVWGKPQHDEKELIKMLMLEIQQAGLSWTVIMKKMAGLCRAYDNFEPAKLITYDDRKIAQLLQDTAIIRNRRKIEATIHNAQCYFALCEAHGSLNEFMWRYVSGRPVRNDWQTADDVPATTPLSDQISKDLRKLGFKFLGSTTVYAYMQAIGMVNDHMLTCAFRDA